MTTPITTTADRVMDAAEGVKADCWNSVDVDVDLLITLCSAIKEMAAERDALRQALLDISDPIAAWRLDLKEDERLEGWMAVRMASDPETYKRMARRALAASGKLLENGNG